MDLIGLQATNAAGVKITDNTCLIMDEVDGMSAGDRGGVGALNALIKKTSAYWSIHFALSTHLTSYHSDPHHLHR
jgi:hypothetical protein